MSVSNDRQARIWQAQTGQFHRMLTDNGISNNMVWVEITSDEQFILACTMDSKIVIWDFKTYERVVALIEHGRGVKCLAIS